MACAASKIKWLINALIFDDTIIKIQGVYIKRSLTSKLTESLRYFPAVAITGARQVGKSTWLKEVLGKNADTVVFDPLIDIGNARADPELFLRSRKPKGGAQCLILDEIQYVPQLVPVLKRMIDEDRRPGQYIITGSQQWEVMKALSESLAGRVVFIDLEGFNLSEVSRVSVELSWLDNWLENPDSFLKKKYTRLKLENSVFETIWRGSFPEIQFLSLEMTSLFFASYLRTYIERDARQLADIQDWELFSRFVRLCSALSAQEINFSHLGRDLGLTPQTARRWLQILKATFQWYEVNAFSQNTVKRISGKPKGYLADTGFLCFAQSISSPEALAGHPLWGAVFETAIAAELRKQIALMKSPPQLYHWRSHGGAEVDIILERDNRYFPIEVKSKSHPNKRDLSGIQAFRSTFPNLRVGPGLVIAPTQEVAALSAQDYVIPWDLR